MPAVQGSPWDKLEGWHDGTERLAINSTPTRRLLTRLAVSATTLVRPRARIGPCIFISSHKVVKTGPVVHLREAATMKFVAENTPGVPVPKVHCAFVHKNRAYIVMDRVKGRSIGHARSDLESNEELCNKVFSHLRRILDELRSIKPPPNSAAIQSCYGGPLRDARNPRAFPQFGPFETVRDFHVWLRNGFDSTSERTGNSAHSEEDWQDVVDMVALQDRPWPAPVFTHGDLNSTNIFINDDGEITAIIDRESAGWLPDYWEYTSAWTVHQFNEWWQNATGKFLDPYPEALRMERTRQRWWGEV